MTFSCFLGLLNSVYCSQWSTLVSYLTSITVSHCKNLFKRSMMWRVLIKWQTCLLFFSSAADWEVKRNLIGRASNVVLVHGQFSTISITERSYSVEKNIIILSIKQEVRVALWIMWTLICLLKIFYYLFYWWIWFLWSACLPADATPQQQTSFPDLTR